MVTVAELKKELDARGIAYKSSDRKADLEKKLGKEVKAKVCKTKCKLPKICNEKTGKCALVTSIMSKRDINQDFLNAVFNNKVSEAQEWLKYGKANPNYNDKVNEPAIVYAAQNDNLKMLNMLLKAGANPNTRDLNKRPVVSRKGMKVTKVLLKAGANPNLKDADGKTAMDYAKQTDYKQMIKLLEKYGAK